MKTGFYEWVCRQTHSTGLSKVETIQSLWSGYGEISRYCLASGVAKSVVVKHVSLPEQIHHPRGWNTNLSHQRKIKSYEVECAWYERYSALCDDLCRVPECFGVQQSEDEFLILLEDLDASGFSVRKDAVGINEMQACLSWLANFHATFMGRSPDALWQTGTYWHLDTRPDELAALDDLSLKQAAVFIDRVLSDCPYQTLVHGDAKLANFCFSKNGLQVAAVDFQYVGGGCGIKDVAYFIGSCLDESDCERYEEALLDSYFSALKHALMQKRIPVEPDAVEQSWRSLYAFAWTDFHRFLKGWSPGHWKNHRYSEQLASQVLSSLDHMGAS